MVQLYSRLGGEFLVNTTVAQNQLDPVVAGLPSGGFVVVWQDHSGTGDPYSPDIRGQLFDAAGAKTGPEFLVTGTASSSQADPTVTSLASGGFVVAWWGGDGDADINGQIFDASGAKLGSEFLINSVTVGAQYSPVISSLASGGFVVTWYDYSGQGGDASGASVKAQIFNAAGAKVGGELLVNTSTVGDQYHPTVSSMASGGFVVAWEDLGGSGGSGPVVKAQIFDGSGAKVGGELSIDGATGQSQPAIARLASGAFVVTWTDTSNQGGDASFASIRGQLFDAYGSKVGGIFLVNTTTAFTQQMPSVSALSGGGFVVSWTDGSHAAGDASGSAVRAQLFDGAAVKVGTEFVVNSITAGDQYRSHVAALASGGFAVAWQDDGGSGGDGSNSAIKAQVFAPSDGPSDIALSNASVSETAIENFPIAQISATMGVNGPASYTVVSDSTEGAFRIDGDHLVVADNSKLDYETAPSVALTLRVTDANGSSYDETFTLAVTDVGQEIRYAAAPEFLVNTVMAGGQYAPAVATLASGGFVVAWYDFSGVGGDTSGSGIKAQLFAASGAKIGGEFLVNSTTFSNQIQPSVTALASGGFIVGWDDQSGQGADTSSQSSRAQVFDASGGRIGGEILLNTVTQSDQYQHAIAALPSGGFVATWTDRNYPGAGSNIKAQLFDAAGAKVGAELLVSNPAFYSQFDPTVLSLASGGFVVSWVDNNGANGSGPSVRAQMFDSGGAKVGGQLLVDAGPAYQPSGTKLASGGFAIAWYDYNNSGADTSGAAIKLQRFDDAGGKIGAEILVNTTALDHQLSPVVAALPGGGFVVTWYDHSGEAGDASGYSVRAQIFDAAGGRTGGEFLVSGATLNDQLSPSVAVSTSGEIVLVWTDYSLEGGDAQVSSIKARLLAMAMSGDGLTGDAGSNIITGTSGADFVDARQGGDDSVFGLGGNDGFYFGTALTAADQAEGGEGEDQLAIQGNYNLTLGAGNLVNVETLALLSGATTRFGDTANNYYDYAIRTVDANVAAGATLTVNWSNLRVGEDATFDGSDESDGKFLVFAGQGVDIIRGGAQSDGFYFAAGSLGASDRIDGGGGADNQLGLRGDYSGANALSFGAGQLANIQTIALISGTSVRFGGGAGPYSYEVVLHNGNSAAGATMTVNGSALVAGEHMSVDGAAELDGFLRLYGGAAEDVLKGGQQADMLYGGLGADTLQGNGGGDSHIYRTTAESTSTATDHILGFDGGDVIDLSRIDANANTPDDDAFAFIGSAAFTGAAGQLRAWQSGADWFVEGDTDGNGAADLVIQVSTANGHLVAAGDFLF